MKKLLALLLILALLTPVFAACGGGEEATSTTENKPPYIPESTEGLKFELNEDKKSYTLVGLGSCEEGDIVIGSYKGLPVTAIASEAFYNERSALIIYEVTIFDGVTQIESSAFRKCIYLRKITLPSTLEFIGSRAFQECDSLTEIVIPDGTEVIDKYAFCRCYDLQKVVLPNSLRSIGKKAFFECKLLSDIKIPSGLLEIGEDAFLGCELLNKDDSSEDSTPGPLDNTVSAFDGKYSLKNGSDGCYTVAKYSGDEKDIVIPKEYNGKAITKIAKSAFSHVECDSITIPNTITSISNYAFSVSACGCMNIHGCGVKQVIFEEGTELKGIPAYAFYNCKSLEKIEIPEGMTVIGTAAFCGCESLKEIKIPSTVTEIGNEAFGGCYSLEKIELPSKLTKIPNFMFYGALALKDVTIPDGVTEIGSWAFASCTSLERIDIPASVEKMDDPFLYCSSVKSITVDEENPVYMSSGNCLIERETRTLIRGCNTSVIPEDGMVVEIGDNAFSYCKGLKSINIPASVYVVPSQAFTFCNSLETITCSEKNNIYYAKGNCLIETETKKLVIGTANSVIPDDGSVEIIGRYSFHGRKLQGTFVIPEGVTTIEQTSFTGSTLTGIDLPDSLTTLSGGAFNASKLESITLPGGVNVYGTMFMDCEYLKTVVISEGAESIGDHAFEDCIALENVVIPSTVKTIGNYAFYNCKSLKKISLPSNLEKMGTSPFYGCDNLEIIEFGNVSKLNLSDYSMFEELKKLKGNEYDNAIYLGNSENPYAFLLKAKGY